MRAEAVDRVIEKLVEGQREAGGDRGAYVHLKYHEIEMLLAAIHTASGAAEFARLIEGR